jgi:hypothetical protein
VESRRVAKPGAGALKTNHRDVLLLMRQTCHEYEAPAKRRDLRSLMGHWNQVKDHCVTSPHFAAHHQLRRADIPKEARRLRSQSSRRLVHGLLCYHVKSQSFARGICRTLLYQGAEWRCTMSSLTTLFSFCR